VSIEEILKTVNDFKNKDKSKRTLLLFGKGDGGGGPTREMLERLNRVKVCFLFRFHSTFSHFFQKIPNEGK
jgi:alpha-mannosidase